MSLYGVLYDFLLYFLGVGKISDSTRPDPKNIMFGSNWILNKTRSDIFLPTQSDIFLPTRLDRDRIM